MAWYREGQLCAASVLIDVRGWWFAAAGPRFYDHRSGRESMSMARGRLLKTDGGRYVRTMARREVDAT
jgi:hypothetical protein